MKTMSFLEPTIQAKNPSNSKKSLSWLKPKHLKIWWKLLYIQMYIHINYFLYYLSIYTYLSPRIPE